MKHKFYIKEEGDKEYEEIIVDGNEKLALVKWAEKHGYDITDAFYGWDDGQIAVCDEKEWKEEKREKTEDEKRILEIMEKKINRATVEELEDALEYLKKV